VIAAVIVADVTKFCVCNAVYVIVKGLTLEAIASVGTHSTSASLAN